MATRQELLEQSTFSDIREDVTRRVYYTLTHGKDAELKIHCVAKLLAALVERLHDDEILDQEAIDDLLLETLG